MAGVRQAGGVRLNQKMCLACGYGGPEVQGPLALVKYRCPSCQADLYARPPRSYAQMEGLAPVGAPVERARLEEWADRLLAVERKRRQRRRRAAFVVGLMTGSAMFSVLIGLAIFML
ncbi:MAG: hypothetical protein ACF8QF_06255 [Phycisphaerales bacterium]